MKLPDFALRAGKLISDNSPALLTAIGVTGTITTAYLTGKASFKAAELIEAEKLSQQIRKVDPPVDTKKCIELVWKLYIPAVGSAATTIFCIVAANRIGTRRAAAMAAAYSLSEKFFEEYKNKVVEKLGVKKEASFRDEIVQDRISNNPVGSREIIISGSGDVLCYDEYTGRYFQSSMEALRKAENEINFQVNNSYYASLSDLYALIGLSHTSVSDELGWNSDELLRLSITAAMAENDRPCLSVGFEAHPIRNYCRVN